MAEPVQLAEQTIGGELLAVAPQSTATRQLDAVSITGPNVPAAIYVAPTIITDPTYRVAVTTQGADNVYEAAPRVIVIPPRWRVIVSWGKATGSVTATLSATELDAED